jgi:pimeloyl-ACP methyl ester carboxylesterase
MADCNDHIHEERTEVDGLTIFSRVTRATPANPKPAVVLIHGLSVSSRPFLPTLLALAPHSHTYALDLPGFGQSGRPGRIPDVTDLAELTACWMEKLEIEHAVLAGHSMGAQVAVEIALRRPELAAGVVLISPTGDPKARGVLRKLLRLGRDATRESPKLLLLVARDYLRAGVRRSVGTLRLMDAHPMAARLEELTQPTLLVVGSRDPVVPRDWASEVIDRLPNGRVTVIPGGNHGVQHDNPDQLVEAIRAFIEQNGLR